MNRDRRNRIERIKEQVETLKDQLEGILDEEETAFDNLPDSLQSGDRGQSMEEAMNNIETAVGTMEMLIDELGETTA